MPTRHSRIASKRPHSERFALLLTSKTRIHTIRCERAELHRLPRTTLGEVKGLRIFELLPTKKHRSPIAQMSKANIGQEIVNSLGMCVCVCVCVLFCAVFAFMSVRAHSCIPIACLLISAAFTNQVGLAQSKKNCLKTQCPHRSWPNTMGINQSLRAVCSGA